MIFAASSSKPGYIFSSVLIFGVNCSSETCLYSAFLRQGDYKLSSFYSCISLNVNVWNELWGKEKAAGRSSKQKAHLGLIIDGKRCWAQRKPGLETCWVSRGAAGCSIYVTERSDLPPILSPQHWGIKVVCFISTWAIDGCLWVWVALSLGGVVNRFLF